MVGSMRSCVADGRTSEGRVDLKCVDAYCTVDVYANV